MFTQTSRPRLRDRVLRSPLVDLLTGPHGVDRYTELVEPTWTLGDSRAKVVAVRRQTTRSVTLTLEPNAAFMAKSPLRAGQHVTLSIEVAGRRLTRCYSPANAENDTFIELTIGRHDGGAVSQHLHRNARPGMVVGLEGVGGDFVLPANRPRRILFVSGGSGITPVLSMLRTLCDEGYQGAVTFLHYADGAETVSYRDELRSLCAAHPNVNLVLAYTGQDGGDLHGFFGQHHLDQAAPWHAEAETFLCGPPALMKSVCDLFEANGLSDRLHTEDFAPVAVAVDDGEVTGTIKFGGVEADNTGATLLEQAEAAGLSPEHGCRMGICFSCTQVKTSGCTRNIRTGELHTNPDEEIQLCISVPVGDVALDL
jgi:ferredoxin-NADP reductase